MTDPKSFDISSMSAEEIVRSADELLAAEQRKLRDLDKKIADEATTVHSKDRSFSMKFDGRGDLVSMAFNGEKYRKMAPAALANMVIETFRVGRGEAIEKLTGMVGAPALPGMDFMGLATGKVSPSEIFDSLLSPMFDNLTDGVLRGGSADKGGSVDHA